MIVHEDSICKLIAETPLTISNKDGTFISYYRDGHHVLEIKKEDGNCIKYYL